MNTTKRKVKIMIFVVLSAIIVFSVYTFVYNHFFRQDITQFRYGFSAGSAISPDEQHSVHVVIERAERDSDISYIVGWLNFANNDYPDNRWASSEPRIIFWQRVETESIGYKILDESDWYNEIESWTSIGSEKDDIVGRVIDNWIELAWIDNNTVYINGINVSINRGFDYRRN